MEIWLLSFLGGLVGSVLMDVTETKLAKLGISSGVTGAYIGRWIRGLTQGVLIHQNIAETSPVKNEVRIGQVFHFIVGGGVVALFYPLALEVAGFADTSNHLILATLFGLITSVLPWLVLMPSFGWGMFGSKAPKGAKPVLSPVLSHLSYGVGIGLTLVAYYAIMS